MLVFYLEIIFVGVWVIKVGRSLVIYGLSVYVGEVKWWVVYG